MTTEFEIVDDAGNEFSVTNIPIPFYIRLKLDTGRKKYRARILDEAGNMRSFYTGVTDRNFLELHVPVIPLRNYGKIIIEIDVSDISSKDVIKHQTTIDYVSQEEYDSIKESEIPEEVEDEVEDRESDTYESAEVEELVDEPIESPELSSEELAYLTQRADILDDVEDKAENREPDTYESAEVEELVDEPTESPELSSEELAYLTQRTEILRESEEEEKEIVTDQIFSIDSNEEE